MGLDAYVEGTEVSCWISSYAGYHAFRTAVCDCFEGSVWGSQYPLLMNHSDCDGKYTPDESELLLEEIRDIRKRFKDVAYPANICYDKNGKFLGFQAGGWFGGIFAFGPVFSYGARDAGIVVCVEARSCQKDARLQEFVDRYSEAFALEPLEQGFPDKYYVTYFDRLEMVQKDGQKFWRGTGSKGSIDFPPEFCPWILQGTVTVKKGMVPALKVFSSIIDRLETLAKTSVQAKQPIVFC